MKARPRIMVGANTFRTLSRASFSKNRVNRFAPLWEKNGPENRVYPYQSHKCGIRKSDNSLNLHIIKYGFNILTRVIVITLFQSHKSGVKKSDNSLDLHIIEYGFNILLRIYS